MKLIIICFFMIFNVFLFASFDDLFQDEAFFRVEDQIVLTASRSATPIRETPVSIFVISREDILRNNYRTLTQVLGDLPGITVSSPVLAENATTFMMRGLQGPYYNKILMDGLPLANSVRGMTTIVDAINIKNVERIEVVYGSASPLYGADAVSGVINIITTDPQNERNRFEMEVGELGYYNPNLLSSFQIGDYNFTIHGFYSNRYDMNVKDGYEDIIVYEMEGVFDMPDHSINKLPQKFMNLGFKMNYNNLNITYDFFSKEEHSSFPMPAGVWYYDDEDVIWGDNTHRITAVYEKNFDELTLQTNLMYLRYRLNNKSCYKFAWAPPDYPGQRVYKYMASDDLLLEEVAIWDFRDNIEIVGGLSFQYSGVLPKTNDLNQPFDHSDYSMFSKDVPPQGKYQPELLGDFGFNPSTFTNFGVFLQSTIRQERFNTVLGLRYDNNSEYSATINPRIAGIYFINDNNSLRMSYNSSFKAPSSYDQYQSVAVLASDTEIWYIGIPAYEKLEPEELESYELGWRSQITPNISFDGMISFSKLDNLIVEIRDSPDTEIYPNATDGEAGYQFNSDFTTLELFAIEGILNMRNIVESLRLDWNLNFSYYTGSEVLGSNEKISAIRSQPELIIKSKFTAMPIDNLTTILDIQYYSDYYITGISDKAGFDNPDNKLSGYTLVHFQSSYNLSETVKTYLKIENLFDKKYSSPFQSGAFVSYNPQPGRSIYGGFVYNF